MPTIALFFGFVVQMYFRDHPPPHFHVFYGEYEAVIVIETLEVRRGRLPPRALALVLEWAQIHRSELLEAWNLCRLRQTPTKIEPLS